MSIHWNWLESEWDPKKNEANIKNHDGIDFADAQFVFEDEYEITVAAESADGEERFITLGMDNKFRLLVVVFTYRGDNLRIISARLAEPRERKLYEDRL